MRNVRAKDSEAVQGNELQWHVGATNGMVQQRQSKEKLGAAKAKRIAAMYGKGKAKQGIAEA